MSIIGDSKNAGEPSEDPVSKSGFIDLADLAEFGRELVPQHAHGASPLVLAAAIVAAAAARCYTVAQQPLAEGVCAPTNMFRSSVVLALG